MHYVKYSIDKAKEIYEKHAKQLTTKTILRGARWLSGRASDTGSRSGVRNLLPPCCVIERGNQTPVGTGNTQEAVALSRQD